MDLLPWFNLKSVPGIGNHLFKRLLDRFESPEFVFQADRDQLAQVEGITAQHVAALRRHKIPGRVRAELERVQHKGYRIVTLSDPNYPRLLREIPDPPPYLYVHGGLEDIGNNIAVVGSRQATSYGIATTKRLCADLATLGITIVSGMARGIDTAAHNGALLGRGKTVAVLGSGLERVYPAENRQLFKQIAENGAVITEFPLKAAPEARNFPIRNRIISGMSLGTVVVEAATKSGSLITARLAVEQNREVFAVPGSIQSYKSTGTHSLIKQGAKLVENAQDILEELCPLVNTGQPRTGSKIPVKPRIALSSKELQVLEALGPYPEHIDTLSRKIALEPGKISGILLQLELKGIVLQSPGKFFSRQEDMDGT